LEGLGTVELADFNEPWKKKSAESLLIMEGLGTISMLFFLPLLTFSFFFNKRKGSLCRGIPGDPLGIQAAGACRGTAEEGP
jgi:hypothetical protein